MHYVPNIDFFCFTLTYFVPIEVIKDKIIKIYSKCFMENCDRTICSVLSIPSLYDPAYKAWLFRKFIFELEASYSFKTTCILVRQVISLKKNDGFIGKIYCLISWSRICTPLILASASKKMASTSTKVIFNSMRVDTPGELLI